jgi:transcriptional regulator with XRE-family HTH domain
MQIELSMDVSLLIRHRLKELGLEQKDLAVSAQVTESYISQLLARKKAPPAPGRTDIYEKLGKVLGLPAGELSRLAEAQRNEELRKRVSAPQHPLFGDCRALLLRKCAPATENEVRRIFEKEPFGELERLVTQKLLDAAQCVVREELRNRDWVLLMAQRSGRSFEQVHVAILEFLDTDVFDVTVDGCVAFLDHVVNAWDIDLRTFSIEVTMDSGPADRRLKRFEFVESGLRSHEEPEPGLERFLSDPALSGDASQREIDFLKSLKFRDRRPSPLYYYRELQSLRDPLHFALSPQPD